MFMDWKRALGGATGKTVAEASGVWDARSGLRGAAGPMAGLRAGTLLACEGDWRPVETLEPGDRVLTFDRGPQPIAEIAREVTWGRGEEGGAAAGPLHVPAGVLGNAEAMELMPDQCVLIESDLAEILYGDPFALVPVALLDGMRGIRRLSPAAGGTDIVRLIFARDEVVFANGSALLFCPLNGVCPTLALDQATGTGQPDGYVLPSREEARVLARTFAMEGAPGGGAYAAAALS